MGVFVCIGGMFVVLGEDFVKNVDDVVSFGYCQFDIDIFQVYVWIEIVDFFQGFLLEYQGGCYWVWFVVQEQVIEVEMVERQVVFVLFFIWYDLVIGVDDFDIVCVDIYFGFVLYVCYLFFQVLW